MSEFEKELENNMKLRKIAYERESIDSDYFVSKWDIERIFKDWQPPKSLPEVPQCVDSAIRSLSNGIRGAFDAIYLIKRTVEQENKYTHKWAEVYEWIFEYGNSAIFERAFLDGYTVEKEKKYILKHIDLSEQYKNESLYLAHSRYAKLKHVSFLKDDDMSKIERCHFTQIEIDKLNIGSYEQIEVEP